MRAVLLNTPECPCPGTHYAACTEFLEGFCEYGYTVGVATAHNELSGASYIVLSSHKVDIPYLHTVNNANPDATYILWFYFDYIDVLPFKKFILTSEHWYRAPKIPLHLRFYNMLPTLSNYVPFLLRANESPENIGTYARNPIRNGCFMGTSYKYDWVRDLPDTLYHNIGTSGLLPYNARRDIYLSSKIAFGFHNDGNILNSHVTQRVFEALCYGCVVLSDNPVAEEMTDGIVVYVSDISDFLTKYNFYLNNPELCERKRIQGYEWAKKYGTNRYAVKLFLDHTVQ
jgi:hypothetical protein